MWFNLIIYYCGIWFGWRLEANLNPKVKVSTPPVLLCDNLLITPSKCYLEDISAPLLSVGCLLKPVSLRSLVQGVFEPRLKRILLCCASATNIFALLFTAL